MIPQFPGEVRQGGNLPQEVQGEGRAGEWGFLHQLCHCSCTWKKTTLSWKIKALYLEKGKTESSPQHGAFTDSCLSPITEVQITFIPAWCCFMLSAGELLCLFNSLSRPGYVESLGWRKELAQVIVNSGEQGRAWKHQSLVYVKGESG